MLLHGLTLTVVGMTVVFIFLTLLVYAMKLLSLVVTKVAPETGPSNKKQRILKPVQSAEQPAAQLSNDAEIAAALAAVSAFTNN